MFLVNSRNTGLPSSLMGGFRAGGLEGWGGVII